MKIKLMHSWDITPTQAVAIQRELAGTVKIEPLAKNPRLVAGIDAAYSKEKQEVYAAAVVMSLPDLTVVETRTAIGRATFPYVSGLLSFRELPTVCAALAQLETTPDIILCDGQGIAHPRRCGLAAHLGLLLDIPTIGCAKTLLVGEYASLGRRRWSTSPLIYKEDVVGCVLRSRANVRPLIISPGHLIDIADSVIIVRQCLTRYRITEPIRAAHHLVTHLRNSN